MLRTDKVKWRMVQDLRTFMTIRQIISLIGLIGFLADWIECYEQKIAQLRAIMGKAGLNNLKSKLLCWIGGMEASDITEAKLQQVPSTLALPDKRIYISFTTSIYL